MRFTDQVVVITGAARGIGFATAAAFAREGTQVVVNDLESAEVNAAVQAITTSGGRALGMPGDVSSPAAVKANAEQVMQARGRIDVLVNNAGIIRRAPSEQLDPSTWRQVLAVNLDGAFYWSQEAAVRSMIPRCAGVIVNVASMAGLVAVPNAVTYVTAYSGEVEQQFRRC
jgi:NAD(P)-dependent dehydrogenase (short-subunit alcohol dehydrogenase family)